MIINIYAPGIPVVAPYVVIKAIEPYSEYKITKIAGKLNEDPFECLSDQCIVPITQDSRIQFWAESSYGDQTKPINGHNYGLISVIIITMFASQLWTGWLSLQIPAGHPG